MTKLFYVLFLGWLLWASPAMAAEPTGTIQGNVVNGTSGGGSVTGLEVTLQDHLSKNNLNTVKTDQAGNFSLDNVSTATNNLYQITLVYQDVTYSSEVFSFAEGETSKSVPISVYETTASPDAISVEMAHTIVYYSQGFGIMEYLVLLNNTDRAYIGDKDISPGKRQSVFFPLSPGATGLQYDLGLSADSVVAGESGFYDTGAVLPGETEIAYTYSINNSADSFTYSRSVNYPMARYDFLYQDSISASSNLTEEEPLTITGTSLKHLSGQNFVPGEIINIQLTGAPAAVSSGTDHNSVLVPSLIALFVLGAGSGLAYRLRRRPAVAEDGAADLENQDLLGQIARLDDEFEAGRIKEEDYRKLRAKKKARLIARIKEKR